jgi:hypothetical protein
MNHESSSSQTYGSVFDDNDEFFQHNQQLIEAQNFK